ncbi:hypothetical protein HUU40_00340 [candidate division KSB1 bacterium]|nr:hypothetical protein [candidate division KSB1 bacterium]
MRLTDAEKRCLKQAIFDGGEICLSGIDATNPRPRRDVVNRMAEKGFLKYAASCQTGMSIGLTDYLQVTKAGYDALL